jgi:hypothetical protein
MKTCEIYSENNDPLTEVKLSQRAMTASSWAKPWLQRESWVGEDVIHNARPDKSFFSQAHDIRKWWNSASDYEKWTSIPLRDGIVGLIWAFVRFIELFLTPDICSHNLLQPWSDSWSFSQILQLQDSQKPSHRESLTRQLEFLTFHQPLIQFHSIETGKPKQNTEYDVLNRIVFFQRDPWPLLSLQAAKLYIAVRYVQSHYRDKGKLIHDDDTLGFGTRTCDSTKHSSWFLLLWMERLASPETQRLHEFTMEIASGLFSRSMDSWKLQLLAGIETTICHR